ncbi:HVA22-like protein h isoform X2 [Tripterygium wilfordii]|uniref:HVA22-like protein h isoform X2 n=1 Tax=Tripterygium wilfordii TaxID=458696 RepID=UPI0018F7FC58|nr:HVA22-like protein h isoform X2 [Tripterygium wilfordii]
MGFVGIFNLAIRCFDLLAWPLLALGYPLRASIMAIETKSDLETRKLVTYWIMFSLLSIFEHAFVKLLEWIPLWLYIKLMIVCWLVIPHFDGSYYVYMHVVRPCLSMEMQTVIKQLKKLKEISFERKDFSERRDKFIDEMEKFVKENGPDALENLIASKSKFKEDVTQKDIKSVEATEHKKADVAKPSKFKEDVTQKDVKSVEATEDKKVDVAKPAFQTKVKSAEADNISTHASVEIKEVPFATSMGVEVPDGPDPENVQKEWTCAVCQVTTKSEHTLNLHLQGRRHKAAFEKLKNQNSKMKVPPAPVEKKSSVPKVKPEKNVASSTKHKMQMKPNNVKLDGVSTRSPELWCFICNIECSCMKNMHSHFKGKQHLSRISELNKLQVADIPEMQR